MIEIKSFQFLDVRHVVIGIIDCLVQGSVTPMILVKTYTLTDRRQATLVMPLDGGQSVRCETIQYACNDEVKIW